MKSSRLRQHAGRSPVLLSCSYWLAQLAQRAQCLTPVAVSVPVDGSQWIGNDGTWSPISLAVGTPEQAVNLFPSTAGQETLLIGMQGCDATSECRTLRGGLFAASTSSTFQSSGTYDLGLDHRLGMSGGGYYGLDTITVGNEGTVENQVIAVVNSTDYWTGSLGLGTANTTLGTKQATSFLESLVSAPEPKIPSLSYAYTAGASYRGKQVPSSLTLGGFDSNRFVPNDVSFSLDSDQNPTLALTALEFVRTKTNASVLAAEDHVLVTIDSTTPYIWLPEGTATNIGHRMGLVYNETFNLFLYPTDNLYEKVSSSDLNFAFGFSNHPGDPVALRLDVLGHAFTSHNLSFGFPGFQGNADTPSIPYFPLRIAKNTTSYTIGRAFLQEIYLTVDYTRNNFSLSQAKFSDDLSIQPNLVDIQPGTPDGTGQTHGHDSTLGAAASSNQLSTGAIIGIAVGTVVALVLIICTLAICLIRRHYAKKVIKLGPHDPLPEPRKGISRFVFGDYNIAELAAREFAPKGDGMRPESAAEAPGDLYHRRKHVPLTISAGRPGTSSPMGELPTPAYHAATELPSTPVDGPLVSPLSPEMKMQPPPRYAPPTSPLQFHQPHGPVELPTRNSTCGTTLGRMMQAKVDEQERSYQQYNRSRPSPASSIGPDGTAGTVSALDSSSDDGRVSPEIRIQPDKFTLRSESDKPTVSPITEGYPTNRRSRASLRAAAINGGWHFAEVSSDEEDATPVSPATPNSPQAPQRNGTRSSRKSKREKTNPTTNPRTSWPLKTGRETQAPAQTETRYDSGSETIVSSIGTSHRPYYRDSSGGVSSVSGGHSSARYSDIPPVPRLPPQLPQLIRPASTASSGLDTNLVVGAAPESSIGFAGFDGRHSGIAWSVVDSTDDSELADADDESTYVIDDRMRIKIDPATLRAAPKAGKMRPNNPSHGDEMLRNSPLRTMF